jgi:hypothetical protein
MMPTQCHASGIVNLSLFHSDLKNGVKEKEVTGRIEKIK